MSTTPHTTPILTLSDVALNAGKRQLAASIDLDLHPGELHCIMGHSGVGKSTLLWAIAGLLPYRTGSVKIAGETVNARRRNAMAALRRRHLGIIYQQPQLMYELSTVENVAVPLMLTRGTPRADAEAQACETLEKLGIEPTADPSHLSGGEQQRVAIARATVHSPALIVADEPTAALDEENAGLVMETLIQQCRAQGSALLLVTHDTRVAEQLDITWNLSPTGLTPLSLPSQKPPARSAPAAR
ncbi:ATP-binding cassette domain-containing protein [Micrococcales bacterium 31B]|nr:ATP-binding cassette domain-containing protein [Micrococcales bacterium 31B]